MRKMAVVLLCFILIFTVSFVVCSSYIIFQMRFPAGINDSSV